jgi:hypothetical protein
VSACSIFIYYVNHERRARKILTVGSICTIFFFDCQRGGGGGGGPPPEAGAVYIRLLIVSRDANGAHVDAD